MSGTLQGVLRAIIPPRFSGLADRLVGNPRFLELTLYVVISGATALVDLAIFSVILMTGLVSSPVAGALSYLLAMVLHYALAVRFVFRRDLTGKSNKRLLSEYVASGLIGMSLTSTTIWILTSGFGASPYIGKLAGIIVSFFAVYSLRTFVIFRARPNATGTTLPTSR